MEPHNPYTVVSLFSGCGGLDLGFRGDFDFGGRHYQRHPFEITWANDLSPAACRTYRHNLGSEIICGDVWEALDSLPTSADVVLGGFPCQDVSINGKGQAENGSRTILYRALIEAVKRLKPRVFVGENVKGLLMAKRQQFFSTMMSEFGELGEYDISYRLYRASDFGVPQVRERIFIVGVRGTSAFAHPGGTEDSPMTAKEALWDLETVLEDRSINHIWSKAKASPEQGSRRLRPNEPATTIRAECHGNSQYHYSLDRRISMREAARIQSFPDDFVFQARLRETERQVGNAVPPVLAWHLADSVGRHLA